MATQTELMAALKGRLPSTRRRNDFYRKLDALMPEWGSVVAVPEFEQWVMRVDCENGARMFDRLNARWEDCLYSAPDDFAALLRIFIRWKKARKAGSGRKGWRGLFRTPPVQPMEEARHPVLSGKYEVLGFLGRGGNGEVYLVWSRETTCLYALKTIRTELALDRGVRQSFRNEARAWIRLGEHPNIAKAFFFEELGPRLYITMAFVEGDDRGGGPSLADRIAAGPVSLGDVCLWFCHVADGLAHAYAGGIRAHRDIKPGNVLIGRDNVARVSDFGLAVTAELLMAGATGDAAGTPLFMAPEQFGSATSYDQRSDLYSLGVSLYQAVSGGVFPFTPAFVPRTSEALQRYYFEIRRMHEEAEPKRLASPLWPVIEKCLKKRPEHRFADVEGFRSALDEAMRHQGFNPPERGRATNDFWGLRDQGNSLMRLGNCEEAIKAFDGFLAVLPYEGSARFNRAACLENLGRYAEAFEVYEACAERGEVGGLVNGSNCLAKLGRREEALAYAKRAVETAPDDLDCWICLGNAAYGLGRWEDAMRAYSAAHRLDGSAATPLHNLGLAAEKAAATDTAGQAYAAFLKVALPDDSRRAHGEKAVQRLGAAPGRRDSR